MLIHDGHFIMRQNNAAIMIPLRRDNPTRIGRAVTATGQKMQPETPVICLQVQAQALPGARDTMLSF